MQLVTNAEELAAALACVDEFDFTGFADGLEMLAIPSLPSSEPSQDTHLASPSKSSVDGETANRSTNTRKRRYDPKAELQLLRGTVKQLEARLAILQDPSSPASGSIRKRILAKPVNAVDKMWSRIADGQFQLLEDSERENARLRGLVQEQLRLIHGLERVLMKKRSKTMSLYSSELHPCLSCLFVDPLDDPKIEKQMDHSMEDMIAEVDRIFADPRFNTDPSEPLHLTGFLSHDGEVRTVESLDSRLLPSTYQAAADAFWSMRTNSHNPPLHNFHRIKVNVTADRALRVIEGKYNFRGYDVPFRTKLIVRRVVRDDRIIFPVAMFIDPMYMNGDKHSGVFLRERSWNVFRAAPSGDSVLSDVPLCYRQSYSLVKPELFSSDYGDCLAQLTKWQIQTTSLRVIMNNEALEDKLLANFGKLGIAE